MVMASISLDVVMLVVLGVHVLSLCLFAEVAHSFSCCLYLSFSIGHSYLKRTQFISTVNLQILPGDSKES